MNARMLWNAIIFVAIGYAVILALVYAFQTRLVYFPQTGRELEVTPGAYGLAFEDVKLGTEDGETLHGWWVPARLQPTVRGTVLFFHGNAGNISHRIDYLLMFNRMGYSTLIVDYRGYGRSTGSPSEEGTYKDATAAWHWVTRERHVRQRDIIIVGESLGGAVATWLAVRHAPRALVLLSTFTSVPDLGAQVYPFIPVRLLARLSYDNIGRIGQVTAPVLVAHSRDDDIIPYSHGRSLFDAARQPKEFLELSGGHNTGFVFASEEWIRTLATFLDVHRSPNDHSK